MFASSHTLYRRLAGIGVAVAAQTLAFGAIAGNEITQGNNVTTLKIPALSAQASSQAVDYVNARPMALPRNSRSEAEAQSDLLDALSARAASMMDQGEAGFSPGGSGDGVTRVEFLGRPAKAAQADDDVTSQEFGTSNHPFSTARANLQNLTTASRYPYAPSGKLFFRDGTSTFVCSAALIKRGVAVTAAHCVAQFGARRFYTGFSFVPAYNNGTAPFGAWAAQEVRVMTSYFAGTETCAVRGIVCPNDVAVIRLVPKSGAYPGTNTGWYGYGWNGYGFNSSGLTHVTQIGYPVCLDSGALMQRNDSHGFRSASNSNNTVIGSLMCGGSSGGSWLVNFGVRPILSGTASGSAAGDNRVVGVTSWGYVNSAIKQQGASPFTSSNIVILVNDTCRLVPAACA